MRQAETAPLFGLYGEAIQALEPGYVHIEDVAARSRALDWRIESHRHANLFQVLCIYDGAAEVRFDEDISTLTSGSVIAIPLGVVHAFSFTPGTEGAVLTIAEEVLTRTGDPAHFGALMRVPQLLHFSPAEQPFEKLKNNLNAIADEFGLASTGHSLMLLSLVRIVLTILVRRLEETQLDVNAGELDSEILRSFRRLLERHYATPWTVARYAAELNTSVSSLNRRCRRYVGLTAKTIIRNRVLLEAKRKLLYTREPIESIAFSLGFSDPAYFSRFFSKLQGLPPGEYRRSAADGLITQVTE
jgi:AraC family transcriptional activator of pobA